MGRKNRKNQKKNPQAPEAKPQSELPESASASSIFRLPDRTYYLGLLLLGVAVIASAVLVLGSFEIMSIPGCSEDSGCAKAAASKWGRIPGLNWPLSSVGLAYFFGLLIAFALSRDGLAKSLRWLVRLSTIASIILVAVMFANRYVCYYCLAIHGANLAFWILLELRRPAPKSSLRSLGILAGSFVLAMAALVGGEHIYRLQLDRLAEAERQASIQQIIEANGSPHAFTGRYHRGPKDATVHIVMFTDFQCADCNNVEPQIKNLFRDRNDISLSIKHFPFCSDCNPITKRTLHPNACRAAQAAEAAGKLQGNDGFWEMHDWLFAVDGTFDDEQLDAVLPGMGYDITEFHAVMNSPEIDALIKADITESKSLGLYYTPMVFINGIQIRGVAAPNKVYMTAVQIASAKSKPSFDAQPDSAAVKYMEDWRRGRTFSFQPDLVERRRGPERAPLEILVWGDYLDEKTAELDQIIRRMTAGREDTKYTFRHYPVNPLCNPSVTFTYSEQNCQAHRAVEAAAILGGDEAFWTLHNWIFDNQATFSHETLRTKIVEMGFDPASFFEVAASQEVDLVLLEDTSGGKILRFKGIPGVFVNRKFIPRVWLEDDCLIDDIIAEVLNIDFPEGN